MAVSDPLPFLRSLPLFTGWVGDLRSALEDLSERTEVWSFQEGDIVRFPEEGTPGRAWVAEGCLVADRAGTPVYLGVREPVDAPGCLVRGQTAGVLVVVPPAAWDDWLRQFPRAAQALGLPVPPDLPTSLWGWPLVLDPGEVPVAIARKSLGFWALRAALPTGFFLVFLWFGLTLQWGLRAPVPSWALWFLPGVGMVITAALVGLVTWEWYGSVLALTSHAVILRQIDVWTHRSEFVKVAVDQIREVILTRNGFWDRVLGLATLEIEGDSTQGHVRFLGLPHATDFLGQLEQRRVPRVQPRRSEIRQVLADRAGGARAPRLIRPAPWAAPRPVPRSRLWRGEDAQGVWFRRHLWFVAKRSLPWVGWTALVGFLGVVAWWMWPQGGWSVAGVTAGVALGPLGRIVWNVWDWSQDRLLVQGDRIILWHRAPWGVRETRQEGALDQVEQVGVRKGNLTALVLGFGTLTVHVGGADPLVFEGASHPEWIQHEIFQRRTALGRDRDRREAEARLDEVGEILDTWDEAKRAGYFVKE